MIVRWAHYCIPNSPVARVFWIALMMVLVRVIAPAAWIALFWSWGVPYAGF